MAKDTLGNEVEVGDYVELHLNAPRIFGRVMDVRNGGTVIRGLRSGQDQRTLGSVSVTAKIDIAVDPDNPIVQAMVKVNDPKPEEADEVRAMVGKSALAIQ